MCGIVGVWRKGGVAPTLHRALFALQHRGQEAAGIATLGEDGEILHQKGRGLVAEALPVYRIRAMPGVLGIAHNRYSTVSVDRSENIQPFVATTPFGRFAIAHNGNIKNADELRCQLEGKGSLLSTTLDTELLVHLIARSEASGFEEALKYMAKKALGAYSLAMIRGDKLYGLRDPHGLRPLVLGRLEDGWILASETSALESVGARYEREVEPGELVTIGPRGVLSTRLLEPARRAPCVFELVYFARPDSEAFGQSVYEARTRMGEELALQDEREGGERPDVVVPVPDSGVPAAIGYARRSGVPFEMAIVRSHYVGRTFILPDQDARTSGIRLKLSVIPEAVKGKRVLLVDDSIVRGNTSAQIVGMVRDAGAREVLLRVASPPLAWPCYLGIDTPDREELVINREGSPEAVGRKIGVDGLRYLTLDGLRASVGEKPHCYACMTGDYPV